MMNRRYLGRKLWYDTPHTHTVANSIRALEGDKALTFCKPAFRSGRTQRNNVGSILPPRVAVVTQTLKLLTRTSLVGVLFGVEF